MKYQAVFGIDHGVSKGFGIQYPDYIEKISEFEAETPLEAMDIAVRTAYIFGIDYLSNPVKNKTIVEIKNISDSEGKCLKQIDFIARDLIKRIGTDGNFIVSYTPEQKFIAQYFGYAEK